MNTYSMGIVDRVFHITITMPHRGDGVPMHQHVPETAHTTKVLSGSVMAYGPGRTWQQLIATGETYDFTADQQQHEFEALEDNTVIVNTLKAVMPEGLVMDESGADATAITEPA